MADILIIGMEMPKTCSQCPLCYDYMMCSLRDGRFSHMGESFDCCEMRLADCPLVELPEHGDLIDRDALLAEYERDERAADEHGREFSFSFDSGGTRCTEWWVVQQKLTDAPVVIPSNKEETE